MFTSAVNVLSKHPHYDQDIWDKTYLRCSSPFYKAPDDDSPTCNSPFTNWAIFRPGYCGSDVGFRYMRKNNLRVFIEF